MASPLLRRAGWPLAAALAIGGLLLAASIGERPSRVAVAYEAEGLMLAIAPDSVAALRITGPGVQLSLRRVGEAWQLADGSPLPVERAQALAQALTLLHGSAPQRLLSGGELDHRDAFGLAPPALTVEIDAPQPFAVAFGGVNPLGLARYAQVRGRDEVALLNGFVADAWERAAGLK